MFALGSTSAQTLTLIDSQFKELSKQPFIKTDSCNLADVFVRVRMSESSFYAEE